MIVLLQLYQHTMIADSVAQYATRSPNSYHSLDDWQLQRAYSCAETAVH